MARTIYGFELYTTPTNPINYTHRSIGKNSEAFTSGDPVTDGANGLLVAGTTNQVFGVVVKTATMAASNETVAKVKPYFIPVDQDYEFLAGCNADLDPLASLGVFYKLTAATTGTLQVDVNSGAVATSDRVVVCTGVDPLNEGGTGAGSGLRQGLFKFVKVFNIKSDN